MDHSQARISLKVTGMYTGCWEAQKTELCESQVRKDCRAEILGAGPEIGGRSRECRAREVMDLEGSCEHLTILGVQGYVGKMKDGELEEVWW